MNSYSLSETITESVTVRTDSAGMFSVSVLLQHMGVKGEAEEKMFEGYEKVKDTVDGIITRCESIVNQLDPQKEYDGVLRYLLKSQCRNELVHRCAMLITEDLPEEDLRELFSDEIYEDAAQLHEKAYRTWIRKRAA